MKLTPLTTNADSFKTRMDSGVDALLNNLPGITVTPEGTITAYGKTVSEILVDGQPFFSRDPLRMLQLIRSSQIGSIAVYDEKDGQGKIKNT